MEKHCNNSQCFKEKNYKAKFLINSILKKNRQRQFKKKNNKTNTKKRKKNHVGNTVAIHSVL
jgi:hypothetical protein